MVNQRNEQVLHDNIKMLRLDRLPIIIELSGLPRLGKTEFADAFLDLVNRSYCKGVIISGDNELCPTNDKWSLDYTLWEISTLVKRFFESKFYCQEVIIADRGFFDSLVWLKMKLAQGKCDKEIYERVYQYVLSNPWWGHQLQVLVFTGSIDVVIDRANERRLFTGDSLVANSSILPTLKDTYRLMEEEINALSYKTENKKLIKYIDTDGKSLNEVLTEGTNIILNTLLNE